MPTKIYVNGYKYDPKRPEPEPRVPQTLPAKPLVDFDHIELFGWFDHDGTAYIPSWDGEGPPVIHVIVRGVTPKNMPLGRKPVPLGASLEHVRRFDGSAREVAKRTAGYYALGAYIAEGFDRPGQPR
jgi:hypothetical protein